MLPHETYAAAVVIRRVLQRTDEDAIRIAACLSPDDRDDVFAADRGESPILAIAAIVCRAQLRTDKRQAYADAEVHRKLIDRAVPVPSGYDGHCPRVKRLPAVASIGKPPAKEETD